MPDAFTALDADWRLFAGSPRAASALRQWAVEDDRYRRYPTIAELRGAFETRDRVHEREALLADLVSRSPHDAPARLVVLTAIRPGLVRLAGRIAPVVGWEEASSVLIAAAVDRLSVPYPRRLERAAARVLGDVWHQVWIRRERERKQDAVWGEVAAIESAANVPAPSTSDGTERFMELVEEARCDERVSPNGARLVVLHRILGYSNIEIARMEGLQACTIRKRRRQAEVEIAEIAVA
jgi:hypothetical protein